MPRVIVFGSINMDFVIQVSKRPLDGETVLGKELDYFPGGKGANQAVSAARLGVPTLMFGKVGDDSSAQFLKDFLQKQNINISNVDQSDTATGSAFITIDDAGENTIIVVAGANADTSFEQFQGFEFEKNDVLVCQNEISSTEVLYRFKKATKEGAKIIYNPAPAIDVSGELFNLADYIIVNETEYMFYQESLDNSDNIIIKTLGRKGVQVIAHEQEFTVPACKVGVLDTTGAGDCFTGALAFGLSTNQMLQKSVEFANKCAAFSIQKHGAAVSMPYYDDIADF